tara:strand:- start:564 stop:959 length:396 start_codon:yes stop_codon:yes gene_type:complete
MTIYNSKEAVVAALRLVSTPKPTKLQLRRKRERECIHFMTGIPNSKEGWEFIKLMKKYLHKGRYSIRLKGRGSRKIHGNQSYIPLPHAEHYSVYIDHKIKDRNNPQFYFEKEWKMDCALRRIRDEINQLLK